ncbi:hypothetical protein E4634_07365 [Mangrovimicrobium sediminis]|uniref:TIGR03016 family PEP-CTERM system-associated outer membrane protein n=1 Tax=Mangrovimicrobium sediminis TaxID=2562682 RepID=A0A4Z0M2N9_9GAMM|nr:hypothetical protein [Haliea sp. SAOS-164]TGD73953.1 hypothetical protein E4634_07365 [Haliea sp. SAOS-164]
MPVNRTSMLRSYGPARRTASVGLRCLGSLCLLAAPNWGQAQTFYQYLDFSTGAEYDSNPLMMAEDEESVYRGYLTPNYRMHWADGPNDWRLQAELKLEESTDTDLSQDRRDPRLRGTYTREYAQGQWSVDAGYEEASTRITEFEDTSALSADGTRTSANAGLQWNHRLSKKNTLDLGVTYVDVSYDDAGLSDYRTPAADLRLTRLLSDESSLYVALNGSSYQPQGEDGSDADLYGASLGFTTRASKLLTFDLSGGYTVVDTQGADGEDDQWNASASLDYTGRRLDWNFALSRLTSPSGSGGYTTADMATLRASYRLTARLDFGLDAIWRSNDAEQLGESSSVTLSLKQGIAEHWSVRFALMHKRQDLPEKADANVAMISLQYQLPERSRG